MNKITRFFVGPERGILSKVESQYWNGLRIAIIGGLLAFVGVALVAFGLETLGQILVITGLITGFIGLIFHFIMLIIRNIKVKKND